MNTFVHLKETATRSVTRCRSHSLPASLGKCKHPQVGSALQAGSDGKKSAASQGTQPTTSSGKDSGGGDKGIHLPTKLVAFSASTLARLSTELAAVSMRLQPAHGLEHHGPGARMKCVRAKVAVPSRAALLAHYRVFGRRDTSDCARSGAHAGTTAPASRKGVRKQKHVDHIKRRCLKDPIDIACFDELLHAMAASPAPIVSKNLPRKKRPASTHTSVAQTPKSCEAAPLHAGECLMHGFALQAIPCPVLSARTLHCHSGLAAYGQPFSGVGRAAASWLRGFGLVPKENFARQHCFWEANADATGLSIHEAQGRVLHFARSLAMSDTFCASLCSAYTSKEQIALVVQALSLWYEHGLVVVHGSDTGAWLFNTNGCIRYVHLQAAAAWLRSRSQAHVMLYTAPADGNSVGHVVFCSPTHTTCLAASCTKPSRNVDLRMPDAASARSGPGFTVGMQSDSYKTGSLSSQRIFAILSSEMGFSRGVARRASELHPGDVGAAAEHAVSQSRVSPSPQRRRVASFPHRHIAPTRLVRQGGHRCLA